MADRVGAGEEVLVEANVEDEVGSSVGRRLVPDVVSASASASEGEGDGGGGFEMEVGGAGGGRGLTSSAISCASWTWIAAGRICGRGRFSATLVPPVHTSKNQTCLKYHHLISQRTPPSTMSGCVSLPEIYPETHRRWSVIFVAIVIAILCLAGYVFAPKGDNQTYSPLPSSSST